MIQEKSGFWDSIDATSTTPGDERNYAAREMAMPTRLLLSNGVDPEPDSLKVLPGAYERSTQIMLGYAWIRGRWYALEDDGTGGAEALTLLHDAPVQYNRIDRVILRYDENYTLGGQYIRAVVLKGMEAEVPVAPELESADEIVEISLARVLVKPGQMIILEADITDERDDESVCGRTRLLPGQDVTAHASRHADGGTDPISINTSQIIGGTLELSRGGTGGADAAAARTNLGAAAATDVIALQKAATSLFATAGAAPAFTVADTSVTAYASGLRRTVQFHAAGTNATLNFNGLGAKALYEYTGKQMSVKAGQVVEVCYNGTYFFGVSAGGGVTLPTAPTAGTVPIYADLTGYSGGANTLYVVPKTSFTVKRACTLRISYECDDSSMGATTAAIYKNGTAVEASRLSFDDSGYNPWTFKTTDIAFAANDTFNLRINGSGNYAGMYTRAFMIQIAASELQTEIDNLVTLTA